MPVQTPEFRPRAGGDGQLVALERFQSRAAPVRRPDPVAPMSAGGALRAPVQRNVDALVQSLQGLNRNLITAAAGYAEEQRKNERNSAEADATALAMRNQDVSDWAQAVAADPSLADRSPYYRQIFEERLARSSVARQANAVFAEYFNSEISGSADPAAIQGFLSERLSGTLERYRGSPAAASGAAEELRQQAQTLTRMHQQRAAQNLVQQNEDSIESRVNSLVDGFATRGGAGRTVSFRDGQDPGGLATSLQQVEAEARAQGVSGPRLNTLMSRAIAAAAIRHGREDLLELGSRQRPDGTPGFGTTLEGRNVIEAARQTILNRAVARQNLAYTQEQRARAAQGRQISSQVIELFTRQMEAGQAPSLTPELIRQIGQASPDSVPGLLSLQGTLRSQVSSAEDPARVGMLELRALRGQLPPEEIINSRGPNGWTNPDTLQRLIRAAESARENSAVLSAPAFQTFVRNTMAAALGLEASGELRDSPAAANIERYIFEQTARFWQQNPAARNDVVATLDHLMGVRDRIVGVFNPQANLTGNRVENLLERGSRNPPVPPNVGGRPIIAPARGADWRTQPAFPSRAALEQAWQGYSAFAQNPTGTPDPANPIFRWIAEGQVDPATFYRRQRELLTRLERQPSR